MITERITAASVQMLTHNKCPHCNCYDTVHFIQGEDQFLAITCSQCHSHYEFNTNERATYQINIDEAKQNQFTIAIEIVNSEDTSPPIYTTNLNQRYRFRVTSDNSVYNTYFAASRHSQELRNATNRNRRGLNRLNPAGIDVQGITLDEILRAGDPSIVGTEVHRTANGDEITVTGSATTHSSLDEQEAALLQMLNETRRRKGKAPIESGKELPQLPAPQEDQQERPGRSIKI